MDRLVFDLVKSGPLAANRQLGSAQQSVFTLLTDRIAVEYSHRPVVELVSEGRAERGPQGGIETSGRVDRSGGKIGKQAVTRHHQVVLRCANRGTLRGEFGT